MKYSEQISLPGSGTRAQGMIEQVTVLDSGYTILLVQNQEDGEKSTFVGHIQDAAVGEKISAEGRWNQHPVYGMQFKVSSYELSLPADTDSMLKYLSSGVIKGIGPALARRIVDQFGARTYEVMDTQPELLSGIKGISDAKAIDIGEQFAKNQESRETMMYLQGLDITPTMAMKIYSVFGSNTMKVVKTDPYRLAEQVSGIGFATADRLASRLGMAPDSPGRVRGGIRYILSKGSDYGHTYLPEQMLLSRLADTLGISGEPLENGLAMADMDGLIVQRQEHGENRVYLKSLFYAESLTARKLIDLENMAHAWEEGNSSDTQPPQDSDDVPLASRVRMAEKSQKIELSEEQRMAVVEALTHAVTVITGGPGTGKTTIIRTILSVLRSQAEAYLLAAPTGRAAKRITEATGEEARTIHRLLEVQPSEDGSGFMNFARNQDNPLEADVVIIDEMSMVDISLMYHLLDAVAPGTRLILLGDENQLPSVGPGSVLHDIIASGCVTVCRLTHIYRQAQQSDIIRFAHEIIAGHHLQLSGREGGQSHTDFFYTRADTSQAVLEKLLDVMICRFPEFSHLKPEEIQVLTPMRKTDLGVENLNRILQEKLNPPAKAKGQLEVGSTVFREGDKVMQIRNNYETEWKVYNRFGAELDSGKGIYNGDVGRIIEVRGGAVKVRFDLGHVVEYDQTMLSQLELAYAMTIHKAQGTESPAVILPLLSGPPVLFTRNLLYTAVTRARQYVIVIGSEEAVTRMIDNNRMETRYSSLADRMKEYQQNYG